MATLAEAVDAAETDWLVSADIPDTVDYLTVESEVVQVTATFPAQYQARDGSTSDPRIRVVRAAGGTTAASHADGTTLTPLIPPSATGGGAAVAGTVDLGDDVFIYQGSGPPASTDGAGRQRFVEIGANVVYDAGADVSAPDWTADAGTLVGTGAYDPSAGAGLAGSEGDWFLQTIADPSFGWTNLLWAKGAGGDTDWSVVDVFPVGITAPVSAADAFGVGEAGPGSKYIDRSNPAGDVEWSQVGTLAAPVWSPMMASTDIAVSTLGFINVLNPGIIRFVNVTFPSGDGIASPEGTYENIKALLVGTSTGGELVGFPYPFGVRIGALFHHVLPAPAQAAGIRLRWDEVNYLFWADQPVADPDTGVITYTELATSDTALAGALVQMLLIAYDPANP